MPSRLSHFLAELKRRKVVRVAVAYVVVGVGVVEGADIIGTPLGIPGWVLPTLSLLVVVGFPISLVLAWALEVTPEGIQQTQDLDPEQLKRTVVPTVGSFLLTSLGIAAVVVGVVYFAVSRDSGLQRPLENRIIVLPFENLTGNPEFDDLGTAAAHWVTDGLSRAEEVRVVATNAVLQSLQVREETVTDHEMARRLGGGIAVSGVITHQEGNLEIRTQIVDLATEEVLHSVEASGPVNQPMAVVDDLRRRVMGALALSFDRVFAEAVHQIPSYEAYQAMALGVEEFLDWDMEGALPHFQRAFQLDTTFLSPLIFAMATNSNLGDPAAVDSLLEIAQARLEGGTPVERLQVDWMAAGLAGDWEEELEALRALSRENPSFYGYDHGNTALGAGRPEEGLGALERVDPDHPYWGRFPHVWRNLARANHLTGRHEEALAAAREGIRRFPQDLLLRRREVQALISLGRVDEIDPLLASVEGMETEEESSPGSVFLALAGDLERFGYGEESQELAEQALAWYRARDPGGYPMGRARAMLAAGRPEDALTVLKPLAEEHPEDLAFHGYVGIASACAGDSGQAEAEIEWLEELQLPYPRGRDTYFRAVITANLGRKEEATRLLRRSFQEGRSHASFVEDPNLKPLWGFGPFEQFLAPKG